MSIYECNLCGYQTGEIQMDESYELELHLEIEHGIPRQKSTSPNSKSVVGKI
jgi:hypothetical protein